MWRAFSLAFCLAAAGSVAARDGPIDTASAWPRSPLGLQQRRTAPLSPAWMVGYWDHMRDCAPGTDGTSLWPDGTYTMSDGFGRWSFSGDTLTIIEERPPSVQYMQVRLGDAGSSTIRKNGPNTIRVQWEEGPASRFYRCDPR